MTQVNPNFGKLKASYLFAEIAKRVSDFSKRNPDADIIKLGIGDVTEPLPEACRNAFKKAVDEMGTREGFRGYPPYEGYDFLRNAIAENDFQAHRIAIHADEVFVSDGAKSDSANIQEIFATETRLAIPDPVYPVYVDTNVMAGRTGVNINERYEGILYLESTPENAYIPEPPQEASDLIYLCFPNNPTGAMATKAQLQAWVDYAKANKAIILYDAAYVAFIRNPEAPKSIYEIPGAREVAIEMRSFSKNAGFTGTRCAYTVIPKDLKVYDSKGNGIDVHSLWSRRQATKFNGVSYPVQRAAEAVYSEQGKAEVKALTDFYMENASLIYKTMTDLGYTCAGGINAPYIWINIGGSSWDFFDTLLKEAQVVCTPGAGFGSCGEGHIRISAFNSRKNVEQALERIKQVFNQ